MERPTLEVADIFRTHGPAWRKQQAGHLSLSQLKVMSAIEQCRTAALGGHALRCDACDHQEISYNSCRNQHCPKCQARAAQHWLEARQADLLRACEWVVYAKRPFAGPEAVLAYLSRYTHRVAISNRRLVAMNDEGVSFRWKDYGAKGSTRHKTMTLAPEEFMRRFLLHVLPGGFHRIRHCGLLANAGRRENLAKVRALLNVPQPEPANDEIAVTPAPTFVCRCCGTTMRVVEIVMRQQPIRAPP